MNTIYRLTTLFALTLAALGADVKFSSLPTATSPSTNSYIPIIDLNLLPAAQNEKYLLTNLATVAQLSSSTNSLTNSFVLKAGDTMTGSLTNTPAANTSAYVASGYSATTSNATPIVDISGTWNNGTATNTALKVNVTDTASGASSKLMDLQVGGSSKVTVNKGGAMVLASALDTGNTITSGLHVLCANTGVIGNVGGAWQIYGGDGMKFPSSMYISWSSGAGYSGGDTYIYRDAANTLALRNGANQQVMRIYSSYTDAANYSRLRIGSVAGDFTISSEKSGTGTAQNINIISGTLGYGIRFGLAGGIHWQFDGTSTAFGPYTDGGSDIGAVAANRPNNVYVKTGVTVPTANVSVSIQSGTTKVCTSAVSNALFYVSVPNTNMIGGRVLYTVSSTDGTDAQQITGTLQFGAVGKATAVTANVTDVQNTSTVSAGTLTATLTANVSTNNVFALMVTPTTSLTTTNLTVKWRLETPSTYTVNPL